MKIILATLNLNRIYTPLALLSLKAAAEEDPELKSRVEIGVAEFDLMDSDEYILQNLLDRRPDMVAFSCYVWNHRRVELLGRKIKGLASPPTILLGGPQVSVGARVVLEKNSAVDGVVQGEGERVFPEWLRVWTGLGGALEEIPGIAFRKDGEIRETSPPEEIGDLNRLPSPYGAFPYDLKGCEVCIETYRGCPRRCAYCFYHKNFHSVRVYDLKRVREQIAYALEREPSRVYLMDPIFNLNPERAKDICRQIVELNVGHVPFHTELLAENVDEELAILMKAAGFDFLEIGLQSSDPAVLASIGRPCDLPRFERGVRLMNAQGLNTTVQIIFGLPGQTRDSVFESLRYVLALNPARVEVFRLQGLPGTELAARAARTGLVFEADPPHHIMESDRLTFSEIVQLCRWSRDVDFFRKSKTLAVLGRQQGLDLFGILDRWTTWGVNDRVLLNARTDAEFADHLRRFVGEECRRLNLDGAFFSSILEVELKNDPKLNPGKPDA